MAITTSAARPKSSEKKKLNRKTRFADETTDDQGEVRSLNTDDTLSGALRVDNHETNNDQFIAHQLLIAFSVLIMTYFIIYDAMRGGLGTRNGRFVSLLDSLDSVRQLRSRIPATMTNTKSKIDKKSTNARIPNLDQDQNENYYDGNENRVPRLNKRMRGKTEFSLDQLEKRRRLTHRRTSEFALVSDKNSPERFAYVWAVSFVLKFAGGTFVSVALLQTPVLFQGFRHYLSFTIALALVHFSPDDIVYHTLLSSLPHRLLLGSSMTLYKYRKVSFAVGAALSLRLEMLVVILIGVLVVEVNSWIRVTENHLSHLPLSVCVAAAPMGLLRALMTVNCLLSLVASISLTISLCSESLRIYYFFRVVALVALCCRYNRVQLGALRENGFATFWDIVPTELPSFKVFVVSLYYLFVGLLKTAQAAIASFAQSTWTVAYYVTSFQAFPTSAKIREMLKHALTYQNACRCVSVVVLTWLGNSHLVSVKLLSETLAVAVPIIWMHDRPISDQLWACHNGVVVLVLCVETMLLMSGSQFPMYWSYAMLKALMLVWSADPSLAGGAQVKQLAMEWLKILKSRVLLSRATARKCFDFGCQAWNALVGGWWLQWGGKEQHDKQKLV